VFEPFVTVYVSGAVRRPGVLRLPPGSRVADAIQAAGGAVGGAAVADLDLASVVQDGQSVRVPAAGERLGGSSGGVAMGAAPSRVGGQAVAPMPASFDPRSQGGRSRKAQRRRRLPGLPGAPPGSGRLVALNRASAADLQRLPGVGPGLAARILAYRKRVGRFQRVEELREVQGIGEKRLARMAPQVDLR
jgi:competence protein ComEA